MADHGRIWFSFNAGKWSSTSEPWFLQGLWNPRRGITLALLLLRLTGTCMVSLVETKRGRPLEFNHQWIRCRKNQTIPPLTPSSCNTTNSCSYNRHEAWSLSWLGYLCSNFKSYEPQNPYAFCLEHATVFQQISDPKVLGIWYKTLSHYQIVWFRFSCFNLNGPVSCIVVSWEFR